MSTHMTLAGPLANRDGTSAAQWCTMERALRLIGTRSAMTLLREAFYGATRFDDLIRRAGVTPAVGSQRLRQLVESGLLARTPYREASQRTRHQYTITELGRQTFPVITALAHLGEQLPDDTGGSVEFRHAGCGEPLAAEVRCAGGHLVPPEETVVTAVRTNSHGTPRRRRNSQAPQG